MRLEPGSSQYENVVGRLVRVRELGVELADAYAADPNNGHGPKHAQDKWLASRHELARALRWAGRVDEANAVAETVTLERQMLL